MYCTVGLIALAAGYLVLLQASKEKKRLKLLGQLIGILVMVGAVLSVFCAAKCRMNCPISSGVKNSCPFTGKMMPHDVQP